MYESCITSSHRLAGYILCACVFAYHFHFQVNKFVTVTIKRYIKKVVCTPEVITGTDYTNMEIKLLDSEKCHINIIALEARRQASVLYGLHAVMHACLMPT